VPRKIWVGWSSTVPLSFSVVMLKVSHQGERSPARWPWESVTTTLVKLSARKSVSGRIDAPLDGASLITSADRRWHGDCAGQAAVWLNCWPLVVSVRLSVNLPVPVL
jgi:hypothetical protein